MNPVASVTAMRRGMLWRTHFWAALIASPLAFVAVLTGILYIFTPQIERALHGRLDTVVPVGEIRGLDAAVQAALKTGPAGWSLHSVVPPHTATDSVKVAFMPTTPAMPEAGFRQDHGHGSAPGGGARPRPEPFLRGNFGLPGKALVVYVNPYTAEVLGELPQADRFNVWARKLHSTLLQDGWRWMIELAASWVLVMLVTGVFLWWPRADRPALPQRPVRGRVAWKQWHAFAGVSLSLISAVMLITGLTWSKHAGERVRWVRDAIGQAPPRIPAHFKSAVPAQGVPLSWEAALRAIRSEAPDVLMQIMPPKGPEGYWRANNLEHGQPDRRFDLLLDAYSGRRLYFSGWEDQTAFGKATAIGIRLHRGEFGVWNQALLLVFGLGVLFSLGTGWTMYFKRRRQGLSGLPPVPPDAWRHVSPIAWVGGALSLVAMPLLAISAVGVMVAELIIFVRSRRRWSGRRPSTDGLGRR